MTERNPRTQNGKETGYYLQECKVWKLYLRLSLERIKSAVTGVDSTKETSFIGVWEKKINFYLTDNNGERCTTAESYEYALKSFQKIMWDRPIVGFKVGKEDMEYWNNGMMHGVKDEAGNVACKISNTSETSSGEIIIFNKYKV